MDVQQALAAELLEAQKAALAVGILSGNQKNIGLNLQHWQNVLNALNPVEKIF